MKIALVKVQPANYNLPLGLVSIATYAKAKDPSLEFRIVDSAFEDMVSVLCAGGFDIIGISAMTVDYGDAIRIAEQVRAKGPAVLVVGGPHISTLPESLHPVFHCGVVGEGEQTVFELIQSVKKAGRFDLRDMGQIKGLVYHEAGKVVETAPRELIANLDDIPMPDYSLANPQYFRYRNLNTFGEFGVETSLITARGCPYKCIFCSTTQLWQKVRQHSPEYVVKVVETLVKDFKVSHIQIWDDLFTVNRQRLRKMVELFKERGITDRITFNCQPRANLIDDELCEILVELNCPLVLFGFESGSDRMLKILKGGSVSVEQNRQAITTCVRHGLRVQGSLIYGSPGETLEEMRKTTEFIEYAITAGAERIWAFVMTPFPATQIWDIAKARGKVSNDMDWSLLSHYRVGAPLLLDESIPLAEFTQVFEEAKQKLNRMKWNKVRSFIRHNFWQSILYVLTNPGVIRQQFAKKAF